MSPEEIQVLHVDDEPTLSEMTAEFLEQEDDRLTVDTADTAIEGLARLGQDSYDCVIADYEMPDQDGIEFLKSVRSKFPNLPFILFTGKGSEEVASDAISAGATDYLQKDTGSSQYTVLANRIANAVEQYHAEKRAQQRKEELVEQRQLYSTLVDQSPNGIMTVQEKEIVFVNTALTELTGYAEDELLGKPFYEYIAPEYQDLVQRRYEQRVQGEQPPQNYEIEILTADDERRIIDLHVARIDYKGNPATLATLNDITEHKERERELKEERKFIQQALNCLNDAFYVLDTNGKIQRWNDQLEAVTGYASDDIDGMAAIEFFPDDEQDRAASAIQEAITTGQVTVESEVLTADGERLPYEITGARLSDPDDEFAGVVGIGRDLSQRKERQAELKRIKDLLARTEEIAKVGGWEIDPDSSDVFWTEHLFNLVGVESDNEPPLEEALDLYHEDDRPIVEDCIENALTEGESFDIEVRIQQRGESQKWVRVLGVPTVEDGEVVALRGAVQDITQRKEREQHLERQNERLEEFASVLSHDLRNPLNVAQGRLQMAMEECDSNHLDAIARSQDRMEALIDDLLRLTQEGEQVRETESVDIGELAETCWQTVETKQASIQIETERTIRADASQLKQVFENLYRNAIEHGGADVTITIGDLAEGFYIEDNGPGIPVEDRQKVFEAGFSTSQEGTGFGLSIVHQVVSAHGWDITVTEGTTGGARFEISGITGTE